jgi:Holliday junction resolvase RusA-like endonuclease
VYFRVDGVPVPQGSSRAFVVKGRAVVAPSNSNVLKPWRRRVREAAEAAMGGRAALDGPLAVMLQFQVPRPATVTREWPTVAPDLDKLVRAVLDGLVEGGVIVDDSRVVRLITEEEYGAPGVSVSVSEIPAGSLAGQVFADGPWAEGMEVA